jgi:hypothetical protein
MNLYQYTVAFPEIAVKVEIALKQFISETKMQKWKVHAKGTIEFCKEKRGIAEKARSVLLEAPKDIKKLEFLKPEGVDNMEKRLMTEVAKEAARWSNSGGIVEGSSKSTNSNKVVKQDDDDDDDEAEAKASGKKQQKTVISQREKKAINKRKREEEAAETMTKHEKSGKNKKSVDADDEVVEGVNWSDSDDE